MDETRKAIAELSAYWKQRSEFLSRPFPDGRLPGRMAAIASEELMNCALQLDRMLEGEPTEARGCGLHAMTKTGTDRVKKVSAILYEMLPPAGARTDYEGDIRRRGDEVFFAPRDSKDAPFGLLVDSEVVSLLRGPRQPYTAIQTAFQIAHVIMSRHPGTWNAFAGQGFLEDGLHGEGSVIRVIYGIDSVSRNSDPDIVGEDGHHQKNK